MCSWKIGRVSEVSHVRPNAFNRDWARNLCRPEELVYKHSSLKKLYSEVYDGRLQPPFKNTLILFLFSFSYSSEMNTLFTGIGLDQDQWNITKEGFKYNVVNYWNSFFFQHNILWTQHLLSLKDIMLITENVKVIHHTIFESLLCCI